MNLNRIKQIVLILCAIQVFLFGLSNDINNKIRQNLFAVTSASAQVNVVQPEEKPDIEWFKEQMKISPKYQEKTEGILDMSWAHFLTMVFLVLFFLGALLVYYLKTVKTRQILERLLKEEEEKNGAKS